MKETFVARILVGVVCASAACSDGEWSESRDRAAPARPAPTASAAATDSGAPPSSSLPALDASGDVGPPLPTRVPMFFAQGKLGRRTVSCDDGRTWIAEHDENSDDAHCFDATWPRNIDCNHHPWSSIGMVVADGYFLATFGWGYPGMVRRTEDGIHWEDVFPGHTFAGMAFGNGRIVGNDRPAWVSTAGGALGTWQQGGNIQSDVGNVRGIGFVPDKGGRFIVSLETGGSADIAISDDNGQSWRSAPGRPTECSRDFVGLANQNGITIMVQGNGSVCRSTDGGDNWTFVPVTSQFSSNPIVVDGMFTIWNSWVRYQSADGITWSSAQGTDLRVGRVARGASGTFVTVEGQYENQQFYRSADGLTWESLPKTAFVASHPMNDIVFGWAKPSTECPL